MAAMLGLLARLGLALLFLVLVLAELDWQRETGLVLALLTVVHLEFCLLLAVLSAASCLVATVADL